MSENDAPIPEAHDPTFEEWSDRVQKYFQMNGQPIPEKSAEWQEAYDTGVSEFEAYQHLLGAS